MLFFQDREISREKLSLAQQEVKNLRFNGEDNAEKVKINIKNKKFIKFILLGFNHQ